MHCLDTLECVKTPEDECVRRYPTKRELKKKLKESDMQVAYVNAPTTETSEEAARRYLIQRLDNTRYEIRDRLREEFNLTRKYPKSLKEMKKWLKDGYYSFNAPKDLDDDTESHYVSEYFQWGNEKKDQKGYDAAEKKLDEAHQMAKDIIIVKTDEDVRLKALQDFESATFH